MLDLREQYNLSAKKANVLLVCADRKTKTRMRWFSGIPALLSSVQIVHGVLCLVHYTIREDIHKLKFVMSEAAKMFKGWWWWW